MQIMHKTNKFVKTVKQNIDQNIMVCIFKVIYYCSLMNFRTLEICLEIYEVDSAKFLTAPGIAWQADIVNTKVKLDLLTDIYMLLMTEKGIRGGIYHSIYRYAKANNGWMKDCDKIKESSYIHYLDVNNLYG